VEVVARGLVTDLEPVGAGCESRHLVAALLQRDREAGADAAAEGLGRRALADPATSRAAASNATARMASDDRAWMVRFMLSPWESRM
jgi:hypothetical protein